MEKLAWAASLPQDEFESALDAYIGQIESQILMYKEGLRRGKSSPSRTRFEAALWENIEAHALSFYERELEWLNGLKALNAIRSI